MTQQMPSDGPDYKEYFAWDVPTRWFHWINALSVLGLIATGLVILNDDALGLSASGKILLKSIHVSFGYVMALKSSLAVYLGVLWQPLRALAKHIAGRPWLPGVTARICGFVLARRAATICRT